MADAPVDGGGQRVHVTELATKRQQRLGPLSNQPAGLLDDSAQQTLALRIEDD